jgi:hypothetical protein
MPLSKITVSLKTGQETLHLNRSVLPYSLLDFRRRNVSDILSNATLGRFAEFIVATAAVLKFTEVKEL